MGIAKGEPWGEPHDGPADLTVAGEDGDLAAALWGTPAGVLVEFVPSAASDLARAVGLRAGAARQGLALPVDALQLGDGSLALSTVVLGVAPDRLRRRDRGALLVLDVDGREETIEGATTVVVASGQWLRGLDLVPRGHPGDGRAEIQAYQLRGSERRAMRARLPTGTHLPHPRILTRTGTTVEVRSPRPLALELDGRPCTGLATLSVRVVPARFRLLV